MSLQNYHNSPAPQALPAAPCYMEVAAAPTRRAPINTKELAEVDRDIFPPAVLHLASRKQLKREAAYHKAREPRLSEEIDFRMACEMQRRNLSIMQRA